MEENGRADMAGAGHGAAAQTPEHGGMYRYVQGAGFVPADKPEAWGQNGQAGGQQSQGGQAAGQGAQAKGQGRPEGTEPKYEQNRFGEVYGMFNDAMNGKADPGKILGFLQASGEDFWKGALVGAAAVFLCNNAAVKGALAGTFGSMFGAGEAVPAKTGKK